MHEVGRSWISAVQNQSESSSDDPQLPQKQTKPRGPKQDSPGRLSGDFRIHKLEKIVGGGVGKKKYPARQCKVCAAHKERSDTRYSVECVLHIRSEVTLDIVYSVCCTKE